MIQDINQISNFLDDDVYLELLDYVAKITYDEEFPGWKLVGKSNIQSPSLFWNKDVLDEPLFSEKIFSISKQKIHNLFGENVKLSSVYFNGQTFGQQGYIHPDEFDESYRTLLMYCNLTKEWNKNWGGGTIFDYGDKTEIVMPNYNSAVYFKSCIFHAAQSMSPLCKELRVSLAYKLKLED